MTKTKKSTEEENYHLTPLGLLESVLRPAAAREAADALALYMIRLAEPGCFVGMTLRDYFAAKAMQGSLANFKGECSISEFADGCYAMADAMLAARENGGAK